MKAISFFYGRKFNVLDQNGICHETCDVTIWPNSIAIGFLSGPRKETIISLPLGEDNFLLPNGFKSGSTTVLFDVPVDDKKGAIIETKDYGVFILVLI